VGGGKVDHITLKLENEDLAISETVSPRAETERFRITLHPKPEARIKKDTRKKSIVELGVGIPGKKVLYQRASFEDASSRLQRLWKAGGTDIESTQQRRKKGEDVGIRLGPRRYILPTSGEKKDELSFPLRGSTLVRVSGGS